MIPLVKELQRNENTIPAEGMKCPILDGSCPAKDRKFRDWFLVSGSWLGVQGSKVKGFHIERSEFSPEFERNRLGSENSRKLPPRLPTHLRRAATARHAKLLDPLPDAPTANCRSVVSHVGALPTADWLHGLPSSLPRRFSDTTPNLRSRSVGTFRLSLGCRGRSREMIA